MILQLMNLLLLKHNFTINNLTLQLIILNSFLSKAIMNTIIMLKFPLHFLKIFNLFDYIPVYLTYYAVFSAD